jgi:hypothetical protein
MGNNEMFDSSLRSAGDLAGVFEYDGDTGYFYLYSPGAGSSPKVLGAIRIVSGEASFKLSDLVIRWNLDETRVGLFISGQLCAVFDVQTRVKYGGDYRKDVQPQISLEILRDFQSS